jgi:hypothetical protein
MRKKQDPHLSPILPKSDSSSEFDDRQPTVEIVGESEKNPVLSTQRP